MIGTCAWCERPAVETVEIEPVQTKIVTMRSPVTGELISAPQVTRFAIYANVCDSHREVRDREGGTPLRDARRTQAHGVMQLDVFGNEIEVGARREKAPSSAIKGQA